MKKELEDLQDSLALVDLMNREGKGLLIEILVKELKPIQFRIEQDPNHKNSPHIHINYGKQKHIASYSIENGDRLAGNLENKYDEKVKIWINANRQKLTKIYNDIQNGDQKSYEEAIKQL